MRNAATALAALALLAAVLGGGALAASRLLDDTGGPAAGTASDGTTPTTSGWVDWAMCGAADCVRLHVEGSTGGLDQGLSVRDCHDASPCALRAYAAEGQQVFATCRTTGGLDAGGTTTWVRSPWHFRLPPLQPGEQRAAALTGQSWASSDTFGWLSARYLAPAHAVEALPECTPDVLAAPPAPAGASGAVEAVERAA